MAENNEESVEELIGEINAVLKAQGVGYKKPKLLPGQSPTFQQKGANQMKKVLVMVCRKMKFVGEDKYEVCLTKPAEGELNMNVDKEYGDGFFKVGKEYVVTITTDV